MSDDFSIFWRNNEQASALFYDLLARGEQDAYDDAFLAQLAAYREAGGDAAHADIFAAQYLLANGDAVSAAVCGERSYHRRPLAPITWQTLTAAYKAQGRYVDALIMQGYLSSCFNVPIDLNLPREVLTQDVLDRLSVAMGKPSYAPIALFRMTYDKNRGLSSSATAFVGEFLPVSPMYPPYYVGVYTEQELHGGKAWMIAATRNLDGFTEHVSGDFLFDLMRGSRARGSAHIDLSPQQEVVLPLLGTGESTQEIRIRADHADGTALLSTATPSFFRLSETTDFSSPHDFIVGTPIAIGHAPHRRRLVLNLLVDALPWEIMGTDFAAHMPYTARFFAKGLTFRQQFSTAEFTYPSLAAIETGMYAQHSGVFNDRITMTLPSEFVTLSERMRSLGYATTNLRGDGNGVYNGVTRGYDRLIVTPYRLPAYEGAEQVIRYLEGLPDADHFIFFHATDLHPWPNKNFSIPSAAQAQLSLADRIDASAEGRPSPYLSPSALNQAGFWQSVHSVDRALGVLFAYLEEHYTPDEYLVNLYSDHGVSIFDEISHIVSAALTHTAWMMRGAGVPKGITADEMTSTVDIYPTLAHLLGFPVDATVDGVLPRIFGGPGREIACSNSLFPTKPYFLAARSATHTLFLETEEPVSMDGTVDLSKAAVAIYPREHEKEKGYEIDDSALRTFFYPRVREFLKGIADNGEVFPLPKEA